MRNMTMNITAQIDRKKLSQLFKLGDLPLPHIVEKEITDALRTWNESAKAFNSHNQEPKKSFFSSKLSELPPKRPIYSSPWAFVKALRNGDLNEYYTTISPEYFVDVWYKAQDLRVVLEVRFVGGQSEKNTVFCSRNDFMAINRVLADTQTYRKLLS